VIAPSPAAPPNGGKLEAEALVRAGMEHHRAGRLDAASVDYETALTQAPDDVGALHLLGMLRVAQDRAEEGIALLRRACERSPALPAVWYNLAIALSGQHQDEEAVASLQRAVSLNPGYVEAHLALGAAAKAAGRPDDAAASFRRAYLAGPRGVTLLNRLGAALGDAGLPDEAEDCFRRAAAAAPASPEAPGNLGILLQRHERLEEAIEWFRRAVELGPDDPIAHYRLGTALAARERWEEAIGCYRAVLALRTDDGNATFALALALGELHRIDEAIEWYRRTLELDPADERAARFNLALLLLAKGDFAAGWPGYECRWECVALRPSPHATERPRWNGEPFAPGQTILLYAKQGFGDTLQFINYAPLVARRGANVLLEVPPGLKPLLETIPGLGGVFSDKEPLPHFDLQCALLSLPLIFETRLETIPGPLPLEAPRDRLVEWAWLGEAKGGRQIGIAWSGNPEQPNDRRRSMTLARFRPVLEVPGCRFHLLLPELRTTDQAEFAKLTNVVDHRGRIRDFADTATIVSHLDLVITTDTAVAHLAGAMGHPLWVLLSFNADWRWLLDREDNPWYPSARLFRQQRPGDWDSVLARVRAELVK
jgi:tetratricopeptide (TPR) repeat protein